MKVGVALSWVPWIVEQRSWGSRSCFGRMIPSAETCAEYFSCEAAFVSTLSVYVKVDGWDRLADQINERMLHLPPGLVAQVRA